MKKLGVIYILIFTILVFGIVLVSSGRFDFNNDGVTNITDLQNLAAHFEGKTAYNSSFDLNNNSRVDLFDIVSLARRVNISSESFSNESGNVTPYFEDGFENYSVGDTLSTSVSPNGFSWGTNGYGNYVPVSSNFSHSGNKSLRFSYPGVPSGSDGQRQEGFQLVQNASSAPTEVWLDWWVYFPSNFVWRYNETPGNNNKLMVLWAQSYSVSTDLLSDLEYQSFVGIPTARAHITLRSNPLGEPDIYGSGDANADLGIIFNSSEEIAGTWNHIQYHLRAGKSDFSDNGTFQVWLNGNKIVQSYADYPIYTAEPPANNFWMNGYIMGWANSGFTNVTSFYIDDFKVYMQDPNWGYS